MSISKKQNRILKTDIKMRKTLLFSGIAFIAIAIVSLIFLYNNFLDISYSHNASHTERTPDERPIVYFGVVSRYSPHLLYEGYQPLMDYLSKETPYQFRLHLSHSYQETIEQLANGTVSAAFLGTFIYTRSREDMHLKCILKPLNQEGKPFFRSVVITGANNNIKSINDLKGKRLALPSPLSYSANWLFREPSLKKSDLDSIHYFDFHNTVVYQILKGNFNAGVVKDRVANAFTDKGIHILYRSEPIPASPIVVHQNTNPEITKAITKALLKIDINRSGDENLVRNWDAEFRYGFVPANDQDYSIEMDSNR